MNHRLNCLLAVLALAVFCTSLTAQGGNASLSGTVHDAHGGVIPAAKVAIKNPATGVTTNTVTNAAGLYVLTSLIPGRYALDVTAPGFAPKRSPASC